MPINLTPLDSSCRLLIEAELRVAPGTGGRFQPTGFPDLGPALYKGIRYSDNKPEPETVNMLLVESAQSIANRLEDVCFQGEEYEPNCQGIPYVRVLDGHRSNAFLTSSVREPHRLASPYVLGSKPTGAAEEYRKTLAKALNANKERPVHIWKMVPALFERDPACILHGVFLEEIDGRIRLPRLVSGHIEAIDPNAANYGGVYRGEVTAKDNIPYPRQEFTSPGIKAWFIIHLGTLNGYNIDEPKRRFLVLWALYKIDRFLNGYLRLRTACEFDVGLITAKLDGVDWAWDQSGGAVDGTWPGSMEIQPAFIAARDSCFPTPQGTISRACLNVVEVIYSVDIKVQEELSTGLAEKDFTLTGFEGRAKIASAIKGKGAQKKRVTVLEISGEWPEDDQAQLLSINPAVITTADGQEQDNTAHDVVKCALKKWKDEREMQLKKAGALEESEDK
jgi:CRISPR-associated protein Csb1